MRPFTLILLTVILIAPLAGAEDNQNAALIERVNRLERDITFLQRQVYRGATAADPNAPMPDAPVAQNQVGIAQLQDQMRELRGEIEQLQYQNKQVADQMKKLETDVDFRLQALEKNSQTAAATEASGTPAAAPPPAMPAEKPPASAEEANKKPAEYSPKDAGDDTGAAAMTPVAPAPAATGKDFPNANEAYNAAFKLFNEKNYSAAATSFDDFVHKYPNDPLTSNAYYWLGESYYGRTDYTRSAEAFRKGFEANPDGQKAPDNLYKLAMSLANVKRVSEACVVLGQVIDKYGDANPRTRDKAAAERTNLQCK